MYTDTILYQLDHDGQIPQVLSHGNTEPHEGIQEMQTFLFEIGYGRKLKWGIHRTLGYYDRDTKRAVKRFCKRNNFDGKGAYFNSDMLRVLFRLHSILDEMQQLYYDRKSRKIATTYYVGSPYQTSVAALQKLLHTLGYDQELGWDDHHNDGIYGEKTALAVRTFAEHQGIESDGRVLSRKLAKRILKSLSPMFGKDWPNTRIALRNLHVAEGSKPRPQQSPAEPEPERQPAPAEPVEVPTPIGTIPLQVYTNSRFMGSRLIAHVEFFPALDRINQYAEQADVKLLITSSFRRNANVAGAIVRPATMSNHMVGHAIDMNFKYGPGYTKACNSSCLFRQPLPGPVQRFIDLVRQDNGLRWGGDFSTYDPVHIDDHYNQDRASWLAKFDELNALQNDDIA